jgi:hypothetical protein
MAELDGDTEIINDLCPSALSHGESFDVDLHRLTGEVGEPAHHSRGGWWRRVRAASVRRSSSRSPIHRLGGNGSVRGHVVGHQAGHIPTASTKRNCESPVPVSRFGFGTYATLWVLGGFASGAG